MSRLTTAMDTALAGPAVLMFTAVLLQLPGPLYIGYLDGSGLAAFGGINFGSQVATYGTLGGVEAITDGADNSAPAVRLTLYPPTDAAVATLAAASAQGSLCLIWQGLLVPTTGLVVADPQLVFNGQLDVATVKYAKNRRTIEYEVVSAFDLFFDQDEGVRLNDSWHQSVWPGERGLIGATSVQLQLPWGSDSPRPNSITDVPLASPAAAQRGDYGRFASY